MCYVSKQLKKWWRFSKTLSKRTSKVLVSHTTTHHMQRFIILCSIMYNTMLYVTLSAALHSYRLFCKGNENQKA